MYKRHSVSRCFRMVEQIVLCSVLMLLDIMEALCCKYLLHHGILQLVCDECIRTFSLLLLVFRYLVIANSLRSEVNSVMRCCSWPSDYEILEAYESAHKL